MPALSKKQQKFMGIVRSIQKGEQPASKFSKDAQDAAKSMRKSSVKKYAATKHKGKPEKVKSEATERDYKKEYKKFQSSTKAKKYRAELNKYNRQKGTYGNGDGKDASHKGGKIVGFESQSKNRGRAEKSRLKKEQSYRYGSGDIVKDINPSCPHHGAIGKVKSVNPRSVVFVVMNKGKNFKPGQELEKSHDQMKKMNENILTKQLSKMVNEPESSIVKFMKKSGLDEASLLDFVEKLTRNNSRLRRIHTTILKKAIKGDKKSEKSIEKTLYGESVMEMSAKSKKLINKLGKKEKDVLMSMIDMMGFDQVMSDYKRDKKAFKQALKDMTEGFASAAQRRAAFASGYKAKGKKKKKNEGINEDGHTDVASSKRKVMMMVEDSNKLLNKLNGMNTEDSLPSWWTDKITLSADYLRTATDYLLNPTESVKESFVSSGKVSDVFLKLKSKGFGNKKFGDISKELSKHYKTPGLADVMASMFKEMTKGKMSKKEAEKEVLNWVKTVAKKRKLESVNESKEPEVITQLRDIVKRKSSKKIKDPKTKKNVRVDMFSANVITQVYDAIKKNSSHRNKFESLPLDKMAQLSFKMMKR